MNIPTKFLIIVVSYVHAPCKYPAFEVQFYLLCDVSFMALDYQSFFILQIVSICRGGEALEWDIDKSRRLKQLSWQPDKYRLKSCRLGHYSARKLIIVAIMFQPLKM